MRRFVLILALALPLAACANTSGRIVPIGTPGPVQVSPDRATGWTITLPACAQEDSPPPCAWDAKTQGNHKGRSFVNIGPVDGHPGCIAYVGPTSTLVCEDGFTESS